MFASRLLAFSLSLALGVACSSASTATGSLDAGNLGDACINVSVTNADFTCTGDSDCNLVSTGTLCTQPCAGCAGPTAAVNAASAAHIASQTSALPAPVGGCGPCEEAPTTKCLQGQCAVCNTASCSPADAASDASALVPCSPACTSSQVCQYPTRGADASGSTIPACVAMPATCETTPSCPCLVKAFCTGVGAGSCGFGDAEWIVECTAP